MMRILTVKNTDELSSQTEGLFRELLQAKGRPLRGFLPAGKSAEGFYQCLVADKARWQGQVQFLQIDEFKSDKSKNDGEFFLKTLKQQILNPLSLMSMAEVIDSQWTEGQFQKHIQTVLRRPIDFALLGLGPNGHIGFHEPGVHGSEYLGGLVELSEESYRRVKGAPSRLALTFGAGSFLKAEHLILLVTGDGKKEIFQKFLASEPTSQLPASLLKAHPHFTVISSISV